MADLLRQLPPDVVDRNVLCFLDTRSNLKLASREVAGLVRACSGSVTLKGRYGELQQTLDGQKRQAQILRQYTFASKLHLNVDSGVQVAPMLASPTLCRLAT